MSSGAQKKKKLKWRRTSSSCGWVIRHYRAWWCGSSVVKLWAIITPRTTVYIPVPVGEWVNLSIKNKKKKRLTRCSFLHESHVVAIRGWPLLLWLSAEGRALSGSVRWDGYDETGRDGQVESVSPAYVTISNKTNGPFAKADQIKC